MVLQENQRLTDYGDNYYVGTCLQETVICILFHVGWSKPHEQVSWCVQVPQTSNFPIKGSEMTKDIKYVYLEIHFTVLSITF